MNTNFIEKVSVHRTVRHLLTKWSLGRKPEMVIPVWKYNTFNWIYLDNIM
jgi:hypothetical protein